MTDTEEAQLLNGPTDPVELDVHNRLAAMKLLGLAVGGGMFPVFTDEVAAKFNDLITDSLSEQAFKEFQESPIGVLVPLLRTQFGLDLPMEDW